MIKDQVIKHARNNIEGWMHHLDLEWLYDNAAQMGSIVELGCWKGKTTFVLASACPGMVWAVDTWSGSSNPDDPTHQSYCWEVFPEFQRNMLGWSVVPIVCDSTEAARLFDDHSVDMVFVDADHTYPKVLADLKAWLPKVTKLFCGHDADFPAVRAAVIEVVGLDAIVEGSSVWRKWL